MSYDRRPDRRSGGRPGGGRPDRPPRDRGGFGADRPPRDRPPRDRGNFAPDRGGFAPDRPRGGFRGRDDDGGMSLRLDPRRLSALKLLAAEAGVRPGELVTSWVEERIDAARAGKSVAAAAAPAALAELSRRVDELARRLDEMAGAAPATNGSAPAATEEPAEEPADTPTVTTAAPAKRKPGRPRKTAPTEGASGDEPAAISRIPLHEEIEAVIGERGPLTASEIAAAIGERGRYHAPRSSKPLDAATVNSRVSNPAYRSRFKRDGGRIGLATG